VWKVTDGLRPLKTDKDVIRFINEHKNEVAAEFYVESDRDVEGIDSKYVSDEQEVVVKEKEPSEVEEEKQSDHEYFGNKDDEDIDYDSEDEVGSVDGVSIDDRDFDEDWEWTFVLPNQTLNPTQVVQSVNPGKTLVGVEASRNPEVTTVLDFEDDNGYSDVLESPESSEEDSVAKKKLPRFKFPGNDEKVIFEKGQIFATTLLMKSVVKKYALKNSKNVYLKKNEKNIIVVKCTKERPYHMKFSKVPPQTYFVLSSSNSAHKWYNSGRIRLLTTKVLAKKLVSILKHTPTMTIKGLQEECKNRWYVILSRFQVYRAKMRALESIHGAIEEQYAHLGNYAE